MLSIIFILDFTKRILSAPSRRAYFFKQYGWIDLLGSLPLPNARLFRTLRLIRALRILRHLGINSIIRTLFKEGANSAMYSVIFLIILVLEFGSMGILAAETASPDPNILTATDAIWWTFVTITTVGYGDLYPSTDGGRLMGMLVMMVGVGLFGVFTGFLANAFIAPKNQSSDTSKTNNHLLKELLHEIKDLKSEINTLKNEKK